MPDRTISEPADLAGMRTAPGIMVLEAPVAAKSMLSFRTDKKPSDDLRVRQALAMAIDHDSLLKAVLQGSGAPTRALVPSALWGHDADLPPYPYDPAKAKALLADAGYANGFSTDLWAIPVVPAYMPNGRRAAEMIQADWAKIGVTAKIVAFAWGAFLRRRRAGEAEIAMASDVSLAQYYQPLHIRHAQMPPKVAPTAPQFFDAADYRARFADGRIGSDPSLSTPEHGRQFYDAAVFDMIDAYKMFLEY